MRNLADIRDEIDKIDHEIVKLYEKRINLTSEVVEYKLASGKQILDKQREQEKLLNLRRKAKNADAKNDVIELFEQIMALSRKRQYQIMLEKGSSFRSDFQTVDKLDGDIKIVYQGIEGAYAQMAMHAFFSEDVNSYCVETWKDAMEEIKNNRADYAVLPIENSSAGIVSENYDHLVDYECYIVGEQTINVEHALLGVKESTIEDIDRVYSHPQALMQCVDFLDKYKNWEQIPFKNTAIAAKKVLDDGKKNQAAIASPLTADLYGLKVLEEGINFSAVNSTRFIIVSNKKICLKDAEKISICFEVPHESGSLYHMLSHFIYNNLNMNKIESRPLKDKRFEYRFFIDFEGNLGDSAVMNALHGLKEEAQNLRILGNY